MFEQCSWLNEPADWIMAPDRLVAVTDQGTDFWRETHYGFVRDNGHFFGLEVSGGFTATLRVRAQYETLYDQAGIMVRLDAETWLKAGFEVSDGEALLGSVLTVGRSDWSCGPFRGDPRDAWIKVTVDRGVLRLQASTRWKTLAIGTALPVSGGRPLRGRADVLHARACGPEGRLQRLHRDPTERKAAA